MDFNFTLNIFTLGCGAYCLYTFLKLLTGRKLFKNALLIPKEREVEDCTDEEGYISYLLPRLGVLTFSVLIYGIVSLINDMLERRSCRIRGRSCRCWCCWAYWCGIPSGASAQTGTISASERRFFDFFRIYPGPRPGFFL